MGLLDRKSVKIVWAPLIVGVAVSLLVLLIVAVLHRGDRPLPDPHAVPTSELLRPETHLKERIYGDLDGVKPDEIVVWSESDRPEGLRPQPYVDIFSWSNGKWTRVADLTTRNGSTGKPVVPLAKNNGYLGAPLISYLEPIDFAKDRIPELVVGTLAGGATGGPLHISVLSLASGHLERLFDQSTIRAGELHTKGNEVTLVTGVYKPSDPGCCPSRIKTEVLGWREGEVQVLSTTYSRS